MRYLPGSPTQEGSLVILEQVRRDGDSLQGASKATEHKERSEAGVAVKAGLLTDEVMASVVKAYNESKEDVHPRPLDDALHAFIAAVEGERKCERCKGDGIVNIGTVDSGMCKVCNGTGKVCERKLTTISPEADEKIAEAIRDTLPTGIGLEQAEALLVARAVREALTQ